MTPERDSTPSGAPLFSYANVGHPAEYDALCEGTVEFNGFYGHGVVDAFAAVTTRS